MRTRTALLTATAAVAVGWLVAGNQTNVQGQAPANPAFAAVPGEKGGLDITGPYDVVADWPKPMTALPGHDGWSWGSVQGIFAESPNRVYVVQRGELPLLQRPAARAVPDFGPQPVVSSGSGPVPKRLARPRVEPPRSRRAWRRP